MGGPNLLKFGIEVRDSHSEQKKKDKILNENYSPSRS